MTDTPVALGAQGFAMQRGATYRLVGWIANAAFQTWPWQAPGAGEITSAVQGAGLPGATVYMPYGEHPSDWPNETASMPADAFIVRGEGTWGGAGNGVLATAIALPRGDEPIHIAQVWTHVGAQPSPKPPIPPDPGPPPRRPPSPAPPGPDPAPEPPARGSSSSGNGVKLAIGGGLLVGVAILLARSHGARASRRIHV